MFDTFHSFDSNDFSKRKDMDSYKHELKKAYILQDADKFEYQTSLGYNYLFRAQSYFVPPLSGKYIFHLACKTRCQFDLSDIGFDINNKGDNVILSKTVGADIPLNNYKS